MQLWPNGLVLIPLREEEGGIKYKDDRCREKGIEWLQREGV